MNICINEKKQGLPTCSDTRKIFTLKKLQTGIQRNGTKATQIFRKASIKFVVPNSAFMQICGKKQTPKDLGGCPYLYSTFSGCNFHELSLGPSLIGPLATFLTWFMFLGPPSCWGLHRTTISLISQLHTLSSPAHCLTSHAFFIWVETFLTLQGIHYLKPAPHGWG